MKKNPGLAADLSFFFSGLGQIYNGQVGKGVLFIIVQGINILLMFVVIGFTTYPIFWIWGMVDAYDTAEKINKGDEGEAVLQDRTHLDDNTQQEEIIKQTKPIS